MGIKRDEESFRCKAACPDDCPFKTSGLVKDACPNDCPIKGENTWG